MTYFPPENEPFPIPPERAPYELYRAAHANFPIGYTDLVPRNPETGELFFARRAIEPLKGARWFIGGRIPVSKSNEESAAKHLERDTGITVDPGRFDEVSYWSIAHVTPKEDEDQPEVRHCQNTVLVIDLTPQEIEELNQKVAESKLSSEYDEGSGEWFDPTTGDKTQFLPPVREFLRDYFSHRVMINALYTMAEEEEAQRSALKS